MTIAANGPGDPMLGAEDRAAAVSDVKSLLRISTDDEDALIGVFAETALGIAESFTGAVAITRTIVETIAARRDWRVLTALPVATISGVTEAGGSVIATDRYAIDIDSDARGWVRVSDPAIDAVTVTLNAGMAADWASLPAPLRQGVVLLAGHLFVERDAATPPPAAVTALWTPFRRLQLRQAVRS